MYIVKSGDSLAKIAKQHNVRVEAILRSNPRITNPERLNVGQQITIPAANGSRPVGKGSVGDGVLEILRQGSAMFTTSFYPSYQRALGYACAIFACRSFDRKRFFDAYKHEFKNVRLKQSHVDGLNQLLGFIEQDRDITNLKVMAYMLATIHHETYWPQTDERYAPIAERGDKEYFNRYDPVLASSPQQQQNAKLNGNTAEGDGYKYRGRGYVQITWKVNYKKCGDQFGRDLVKDPDLALEPQLSYNIASFGMRTGLFTGKKIGDYINGSVADYVNARRVINKLDKAKDIADYAQKFERVLAQSIEG